jgi:hypothetical protein
MKQKNLENKQININYLPKEIRKNYISRYKEKNKIKNEKKKRIKSYCRFCGEEIKPPFFGTICKDCMETWDQKTWAKILARDFYGKATKCMKCGLVSSKGIDWHHPNPSKPLEVMSLCKKCHGLAEKMGDAFK